MNIASRLPSRHRRALLACVVGGLPTRVLWAQDRSAQAPPPALWWPPERHWQLLRERAPQSPEVQAVMKAQYQLLARGWSQPPHALAHLPAEPHWQGEAPPRRVADSLGEFEQLQALAFLYTLNGQAAYRERALELLRPWARSLGPVAQPLALRWLEPAMWAYRLLRPHLGTPDRARLDAWWQAHALAQQGDRQLDRPDALDRRNSHRLCSIGLIGWALGDATLVESARRGLQQQLMDALLPTGESLDYRQSGRLADQVDALRPLLTLALALRESGDDLYHWGTPAGASMARSVAWLLARTQNPSRYPELRGQTVEAAQLQPLQALIEAWQPGLTPLGTGSGRQRSPAGVRLRLLLNNLPEER